MRKKTQKKELATLIDLNGGNLQIVIVEPIELNGGSFYGNRLVEVNRFG